MYNVECTYALQVVIKLFYTLIKSINIKLHLFYLYATCYALVFIIDLDDHMSQLCNFIPCYQIYLPNIKKTIQTCFVVPL